jgi:large conductance mechanosensitive channel
VSIISEFKAFAMRGNVIDLAVGVVIGGAFGKIVTSLVGDLIMPPLNLLTAKSGVNFKDLAYKSEFTMPVLDKDGKSVMMADGVTAATEVKNVTVLNYGNFLQNIVDFLIVAFAIFMAVRLINSLKKPAEDAPPPATPEDVILLREIRDALAKSSPRRVD